jgi:glutamate racemase
MSSHLLENTPNMPRDTLSVGGEPIQEKNQELQKSKGVENPASVVTPIFHPIFPAPQTAHLMAGTQHHTAQKLDHVPRILVFDSGVGGLSVYTEILKAHPHASFTYLADNACFPYGKLDETVLVARVLDIVGHAISTHNPDLVVVACNTASTLVLPHLRRVFTVPFVGTVPAIKSAVFASRSKHITVLATEGTIKRDYTHDLIRNYAQACHVTLIGAQNLARMAEAELAGEPVSDADLWAEISPCFVETNTGKTDAVVLACTHYPLLRARFERLAPWTVAWIDPAPAIARRVSYLLGIDAPEQDEGKSTRMRSFEDENKATSSDEDLFSDTGLSTIPETEINLLPLRQIYFTSVAGLSEELNNSLLRYGFSSVSVDPSSCPLPIC